MPGRMGAETVTTQNVAVVAVHPDEGVVLIRGSVPGPRGGVVVVRTTGQKANLAAPEAPKEGKKDKAAEEKAEAGDKKSDDKPDTQKDAKPDKAEEKA